MYIDRLIRRHGCYDHPGKEAAQHGEELAHDEKKSKRVNVKLKVDRELEIQASIVNLLYPETAYAVMGFTDRLIRKRFFSLTR